jgi:membrane-bound inhibitor of C-type lysozyme
VNNRESAMQARNYVAVILAVSALSGAAHAQQVRAGMALTIELPVEAGSEAGIVPATYSCGGTTLEVTYVNAEPNLLAIVPIEGKSVVFSSSISASGARYTSGKYE